MKKIYFQNLILFKILVVIGLLLEMMILFEIPIIAVIYIWCQLNKGMEQIGPTAWGLNNFLRCYGSIFLWHHPESAVSPVGALSLQYDRKRRRHDRVNRNFRRSHLLLPKIPIRSRFWRR